MGDTIGLGSSLPSPSLAGGELVGKSRRNDPAQVSQAAEQFEALLLGQLMKSAREASGGGGWLGAEDEAGQTMGELAEQHLAQSIAAGGGLGLARMIRQGLSGGSRPG
jgi:peptidoglycan hydrolase FlgJ